MTNKFAIALGSAASLALAACGEPAEDAETEETMAVEEETGPTIVELAQEDADLSMLVAAIDSAGIGETLAGEGPYTVFAPANSAFEAVPQATRDTLMSEEGKDDLSAILTYHVVDGATMSDTLTQAASGADEGGYGLTTLNGADLMATMEDDELVLTDAAGNSARVTQADIEASNGVVHVIDTVLMPE